MSEVTASRFANASSSEVEELVSAWEAFSVPLRMKDGFDESSFAGLASALTHCAQAWRGSDAIPRLAVNVLVDIAPAMEALATAYEETMATRIRDAGFRLQELVADCVAVDDPELEG
jgi:hypothetical protein